MNTEKIEFDLVKMQRFAERDLLIKRMAEDLGNDERAFKVVFNSEVVGDSLLERIYLSL